MWVPKAATAKKMSKALGLDTLGGGGGGEEHNLLLSLFHRCGHRLLPCLCSTGGSSATWLVLAAIPLAYLAAQRWL